MLQATTGVTPRPLWFCRIRILLIVGILVLASFPVLYSVFYYTSFGERFQLLVYSPPVPALEPSTLANPILTSDGESWGEDEEFVAAAAVFSTDNQDLLPVFGRVTLNSVEVAYECKDVALRRLRYRAMGGPWTQEAGPAIVTGLKSRVRYEFQVACEVSSGELKWSPSTSVRTALVGAITVALNEEALLCFVVGALIEHVDRYVVVDTGSTDRSIALLHHLFGAHIESRRLIIVSLPLTGALTMNMALARTAGLKIMEQERVDHFFHVDADDIVTTDAIAAKLVLRAKQCALHLGVSFYTHDFGIDYHNYPLETSEAVIRALQMDCARDDADSPFHRQAVLDESHFGVRVLPMYNVAAEGHWENEARGNTAEGYRFGKSRGFQEVVHLMSDVGIASYSMVRPLPLVRAKWKAWSPDWEFWDFVDFKLGSSSFWVKPVNHPEAICALSAKILQAMEEMAPSKPPVDQPSPEPIAADQPSPEPMAVDQASPEPMAVDQASPEPIAAEQPSPDKP